MCSVAAQHFGGEGVKLAVKVENVFSELLPGRSEAPEASQPDTEINEHSEVDGVKTVLDVKSAE